MPTSSLLHPIAPPLDPLPLYTRDPETTSIRSSAPSYTSRAPSYRSSQPPNPLITHTPPLPTTTTTSSLPNPRFAPGFGHNVPTTISRSNNISIRTGARTSTLSPPPSTLSPISEWSLTNGPQARHYQAVARRRAMSDRDHDRAPPFLLPTTTAPTPTTAHIPNPTTQALTYVETAPQRSRGGGGGGEDAALVAEGKSWDFLLAQMADWKVRERSWEGFRREVERKGGKRGKEGRGVLGLGRWGRGSREVR